MLPVHATVAYGQFRRRMQYQERQHAIDPNAANNGILHSHQYAPEVIQSALIH